MFDKLFKKLEENGYWDSGKPKDATKKETTTSPAGGAPQPSKYQAPVPMYFPVHGGAGTAAVPIEMSTVSEKTVAATFNPAEPPDATFVKFFEDEMKANNPPGLDYFEFRHQYNLTHDKLKAKNPSPDVILTAVLVQFETSNVTTQQLITSAAYYKGVLTTKRDVFLDDSKKEKEGLLQQRQTMIDTRANNIQQKQKEAEEIRKRLLEIDKEIEEEKTQMELARTAGNEAIAKYEDAEARIKVACAYMTSTIDSDINLLSQHS